MINHATNKIFIVEKKYQEVAGSVDEKLQTCDFKLKQFKRLTKSIDFEVQYYYVLSDFFKKEKYRDVLDYINEVRCKYFFNTIPLEELDLDYETISNKYRPNSG